MLIALISNPHHFTSKSDNPLSSPASLVRMIVHFKICVVKLISSISQPVYVADEGSSLKDQVCLVGLQDVFAQAWIVQQAHCGHRDRNSVFHRSRVRDLITWTDRDVRFLIKKPACGNVDAIDAVFFKPFPDCFPIIHAVLLF